MTYKIYNNEKDEWTSKTSFRQVNPNFIDDELDFLALGIKDILLQLLVDYHKSTNTGFILSVQQRWYDDIEEECEWIGEEMARLSDSNPDWKSKSTTQL